MNLFINKHLDKPGYLRPFLRVLDEFEVQYKYAGDAFRLVRDYIERSMYDHLDFWELKIEKSQNPRIKVYIAINNTAYDYILRAKHLLSTKENIPGGLCSDLIEFHNFTAKELLRIKYWSVKNYLKSHDMLDKAILAV